MRAFLDLTSQEPKVLAGHMGLSALLEHAGQIEDAVGVLSNAVAVFPTEPQIYLRLGNLLAGQGRWDAAERCYAGVCKLQPDNANAQHNWGVSLLELGRAQEAIAAYERAIEVNPGYAYAYYSLGLAYQTLNLPEAALIAFDCAIQLDANNVQYVVERARMRVSLGQHAEALKDLDRLIGQGAADTTIQNLRGLALKNLRRPDEAMAAFNAAVALKPDHAEALSNRGNLWMLQRKFARALDDLTAAVALQPSMDWLQGNHAYAAAHIFDWSSLDAEIAEISMGVRKGARVIQPLALQTLVDDPQLQQAAARIWTEATCPQRRAVGEKAPARTDGRIRIAYVSRDFKSHPVSFLISEVIELHDRERFEVIGIHYGAKSNDPAQDRLRDAFDSFLDVEHLSDEMIGKLCRSTEIDIAIDLSGFTDGARSGIFSMGAAPIQVSYLGYLGTAGAPLYDYLIADRHIIPSSARSAYAEKIAFLPWYQANDRKRPRPEATVGRTALGLPEAGFVYCCFNNPCKISPATFASWARILHDVPGSVLWLLGEDDQAPQHLRATAQAMGLDPARLVFAARADRTHYLANLATADLFLDTLPYNAGTTASDALWMGLPVLTQRGESFQARVACSVLEAAGLPDLVAGDEATYVELAVKLGNQREHYQDVRRRVATEVRASRLFDTAAFTRNLETAYSHMVIRSTQGLPPEDLAERSDH